MRTLDWIILTMTMGWLCACASESTKPDLSVSRNIPAAIHTATTQVADAHAGIARETAGIRQDTSTLRTNTPADAKPVVLPVANSIDKHAAEIDTKNAQLVAATTALARAEDDASKTHADLSIVVKEGERKDKEIARLKSNDGLYHKMIFWGVIVIAAGVAGMLLLGKLGIDPGYGAIVSAGGGVLLLTTLVVQQVDHALASIVRPFVITSGVLLAVGVAWLVAEIIWRKRSGKLTWAKAITVSILTGPIEDAKDIQTNNPTHGAGTTPISASAGVGQAVPAPVMAQTGQVTSTAAAVEDER